MIVQPDFPEHWKTRHLIELTGDESAPLAVIRLWAHCQHSRRSEFPEMTKEQLASVCRWNDRKPPCHVALVKAGFVERLTPKGYAAHQWSEHNAQLLQKWQAGQKGGRPPTAEKANEMPDSEKPTDNRPLTGTKPDRPDQIDQTRLIDQIDQTRADGSPSVFVQLRRDLEQQATGKDGLDGNVKALVSDGRTDGGKGVEGLACSIAQKLTPRCGVPTLQEVRNYLLSCFNGAADYAEAFYKAKEKDHWQVNGKPIHDWKALAKRYASTCYMKR